MREDLNHGGSAEPSENFQRAVQTAQDLHHSLGKVIKGRDDTIRLTITALLADGHVLLEDYPGSGKTLLTKTLGRLIRSEVVQDDYSHILPFRRIQFTPDMLPGDVLGVNVFDAQSGSFRFLHGPVFAHVVLADELNRTGPKVQAAFLECMAEKQVTIDNVTHRLDQLFFVVGTQNPLDLAGTYPLPLVQLDRFLLKIPMSYVDASSEIEILRDHESIMGSAESLEPVCSREQVLAAQRATKEVFVSDTLRRAIVDLVQETRSSPLLQFGVSTRAGLMLQSALRAWALVNGKTYVDEDDLKYIAPFVLRHRLKFSGGVSSEAEAFEQIISNPLERLIRASRS
ncbi:MAG: MoxR family ATPase [Bdellovibrionales bacterium]|nr:MoxR family ATPase [Bdellovibrionales bacterium]